MRRAGLALASALCALAGALAAVLLAGPSAAATAQTTEPPPSTEPAPTTTAVPATLPEGVSIGGVPVGGLDAEAAVSIVRSAFTAPLVVRVAGRTLAPTPAGLGALAYVRNAVAKARTASAGVDVPVYVRLDGAKLRAYVGAVARRFDRAPRDARVVLRGVRPAVVRDRPGRTLDRLAAQQALIAALRTNEREPVALAFRTLAPKVTRKRIGPVVVIRRGSNRLFLYDGARYRRSFVVATGTSRYPTPLGRFRVVSLARNPWWFPPDSDWAKGQDPIPPGPGNPLGTRWMGISAPGVGIHGTPDAASLGYSASHGCIRMAIPDAEWLFNRLRVGATVFVVRS